MANRLKTTKRDFEFFKAAALEWQQRLGLTDWNLYFVHEKVDECYAQTRWELPATLATITLSLNWDSLRPKTDEELKVLALHEVLHVLFAPYCSAAEDRYLGPSQLHGVEHAIIRRLEKVLYGQKENEVPVSPKRQG